MEQVATVFAKIDEVREYNQLRVLDAFRECRFSDVHLDRRLVMVMMTLVERRLKRFLRGFCGQAAYVRMQLVQDTVISSMLYGLLRPGDELLSLRGNHMIPWL